MSANTRPRVRIPPFPPNKDGIPNGIPFLFFCVDREDSNGSVVNDFRWQSDATPSWRSQLAPSAQVARDRIPPFPPSKNGIPNGMPFLLGGKGGIRTLGRVLADTRFPVVRLRPAQPPFRTQALTLYHAGNKKSTPFLRLFKKIFIFCQNALLQIRNFLTNPPGEHIIKHIINE